MDRENYITQKTQRGAALTGSAWGGAGAPASLADPVRSRESEAALPRALQPEAAARDGGARLGAPCFCQRGQEGREVVSAAAAPVERLEMRWGEGATGRGAEGR